LLANYIGLKILPVTQRRQRTHRRRSILVQVLCLPCQWHHNRNLQGWFETVWNCKVKKQGKKTDIIFNKKKMF